MTFCPICYKQTEKEIWKRENNCREIRWIFCPNHGYVRDNQERTALNVRIEAAKKRRKKIRVLQKAPAMNNRGIFLIGKGLIVTALFLIVSFSAALGFFVGLHAGSGDSMPPNLYPERTAYASHGDQEQNALVQRDFAQPLGYNTGSGNILLR